MDIKTLERQATHTGNYVSKMTIFLHRKDREKLNKRCEKFNLEKADILRGLIDQYLSGEIVLTSTVGEPQSGERESFTVRLTASQYKEFQEKCGKDRRTPTAVLRTMVTEYLHAV